MTSTSNLSERVLSASIGALLTSFIVTPLEVVKVRLQAQAGLRAKDLYSARSPLECAECKYILLDNGLMENRFPKKLLKCNEHVQFKGTIDAITWIIRCEGIASLYNGLQATLWMAIPATVLYFAAYEELRNRLNESFPKTRSLNPLIAGAFARIFAASFVAPLELIRTNAQARSNPPNMMNLGYQIARENGVRSLWKGLSPTLLRDVPFSAIYWVIVEKLRGTEILKQKSIATSSMISGTIGGAFAALVTHPFDVIKTRQQVFELANTNTRDSDRTFKILNQIMQKEGWKSLFTGLLPRVAKIAPSTAIMLTSYEVGKYFFQQHGV